MFVVTLVLLFILRVRFPPSGASIGNIVFTRYGLDAHRVFRKVEKITRKVHKCECDIEFLETCASYETVPKFLRIKLYRRGLERTDAHKAYQLDLLRDEISYKFRSLHGLKRELTALQKQLKNIVSCLDYSCLSLNTSRKQSKINEKTRAIHDKKLFNLGISPIRHHLDPKLIIKNLSDRQLTPDEISALMLGLDFGIPPKKLNFSRYFPCFEKW